MNWTTALDFVNKYFKLLVFVIVFVFLAGGAFAIFNAIPGWRTSITRDLATELQKGMDVKLDQFNNKLELQGQKIDSVTYLSATKFLTNPGLIARITSAQAREQKRLYDSLMSSIPETIKKEFDKNGSKPHEVGTTTITIDSVLIEVKVGNSVKFARGALTYEKDKDSYLLELYPDQITITSIQGEMKDNGFILNAVTAKSSLTGQIMNIKSNVTFLNWEQSHWDWHPYVFFQPGVLYSFDGKLLPDGQLGAEWIKYNNGYWTWDVLNGAITRNGITVATGIKYKF